MLRGIDETVILTTSVFKHQKQKNGDIMTFILLIIFFQPANGSVLKVLV